MNFIPKQLAAQEEEYSLLLELCRELGISSPSELSREIRHRNLGCHFPKISGRMDFSHDEDNWDMDGAITPAYYKRP